MSQDSTSIETLEEYFKDLQLDSDSSTDSDNEALTVALFKSADAEEAVERAQAKVKQFKEWAAMAPGPTPPEIKAYLDKADAELADARNAQSQADINTGKVFQKIDEKNK